jgi:hypothetical protein
MNETLNTIIEQLGGKRIFAIAFKYPIKCDTPNNKIVLTAGTKCKAKYTEIKYNYGTDLYDLRFLNTYKHEVKVVAEVTDIYADSLIDVVERNTGLRLSL